MTTRPDVRELTTNVREAFAEADRETLLDVLAFVVREYVVDGPPPGLIHQVEKVAELAGLSFAQLIATLQTRFEHAEWGLFAVDGENVSVRVGGVMQPLAAQRGATTAELPRPAAGVRVVEAGMAQLPRGAQPMVVAPPGAGTSAATGPASPASPTPTAAPASAATSREAPRPTAGLALRGRSDMPSPGAGTAGGAAPANATGPGSVPPPGASGTPPGPAAPQAGPSTAPDKPSGDDSAVRFSLLELD